MEAVATAAMVLAVPEVGNTAVADVTSSFTVIKRMKREIGAFFWLTCVIHSCIGTTDPGTSCNEKDEDVDGIDFKPSRTADVQNHEGHEATVGKDEGNITLFIAAIIILLICIRYYLKSNKNHRPTSENQPFQRSSQAIKRMKRQITALLHFTFAILLGLGTEMDVATANDEKGHEATAGKNITNIIFLIVIIIPSIQGNILFNFPHYAKQKENHRKVSEEGSFEQSSLRNDAEASEIRTETALSVLNTDVKNNPEASEVRTEMPLSELNTGVKSILEDIKQQHRLYLHKMNENITITGENRRIWRCPLSERYTKVTIIASLDEQEQIDHALKIRSMAGEEFWRKTEQNHPEEIPLDCLLRKHCNQTVVSRTTLIIGPSGFGKSTTIRKIIHGWAAGKMYQEIHAIFPFEVQQLNSIDGETCLNELILYFFPRFENCLELLWKEPEKILFIFDDLDLFQTTDFTNLASDNDHEYQYLGPEHFCNISHIVCCLLKGRLLKGCSVLATSSPWKLQTFANVGSNRALDILGFSADTMKQYFQCCLAAEQFALDVLNYIEHDEMFYTMCHNPRFCSVLCSMLEVQQNQRAPMPVATTNTRMLLTFVTCPLRKCYYEDVITHFMLLRLGSLAYWGVCNKTIVFKVGQFKQHKLPFSNWISAFMMEIQDNNDVGYVFTHAILKDFVAALFKSQSTTVDQVKKTLTEWYNCNDDRFKFVSRFFIGLSSPNLIEQIGFYWDEQPSETASNVSDWLKEKFNSCVQNLESDRNQRKLLEILYCLLEFGDAALMEDVLTPMKTIRFTKCPLKTFDCMILSKTLMIVQEIEKLDLDSCDIDDEGIHQLEQVLHKCEILSLNMNKLSDLGAEYLCAILKKEHCKIQTLSLLHNQFSEKGLKRLKSICTSNDLTVITE
ncbi:NACHT, LRR and PYD domains-containing protein 12-like [Rhincodon typus]|uniref:NACHT, LRR and PYD domains-containing protein 12-like n=1 Tax=Rhincodon typus TaxID=259920 RepID=UPI00202F99DB|nr:NACHT, LRR and PYD domains-containing protein 12-like [Rhincodon typus]